MRKLSLTSFKPLETGKLSAYWKRMNHCGVHTFWTYQFWAAMNNCQNYMREAFDTHLSASAV